MSSSPYTLIPMLSSKIFFLRYILKFKNFNFKDYSEFIAAIIEPFY